MRNKILKLMNIDLNKIMSEAFEKGYKEGYRKGNTAKNKERKIKPVAVTPEEYKEKYIKEVKVENTTPINEIERALKED